MLLTCILRVHVDMRSRGSMKDLQIGELARLFGLAPHVLRHWEAMGLLSPAARRHGRRRYDQGHVTRVAVIIRGQEAGLSLSDVRELLETSDQSSRRVVLERHKAQLEARLADIQASKQMIEHALECRHEDFTACPAFQRAIQGVVERYSKGRNSTRPDSNCPSGRRLADRRPKPRGRRA
jgi:MerR family copper efflux transcriptional regulator